MDKSKRIFVEIHNQRVFATNPETNLKREIPVQFNHDFWRNPTKHTHFLSTEDYKKGAERSEKLVSLFGKFCSKDDKILELGCNVGRNLDHLYRAGYKNLTGLDICREALELGKKSYPDTVGKIPLTCSSIEDCFYHNKIDCDIIFTMTVLMHLHPSSFWVFEKIRNLAKKHLILVEEEGILSETVFPYNFKDIFEAYGMKQIHEECVEEENLVGSDEEIKIQYRIFKNG